MKRNDEYKQLFPHYGDEYDILKGKVVDKVAFMNRGDYDTQMFLILFTDKTYVCVGMEYANDYNKDLQLEHNYMPWFSPTNVNTGDFSCHSWVDADGKIHFEKWIDVLRDFGIWEFTDEDAIEIMEKHKRQEEEREYQQYLRLKEKFEGKNKEESNS